MKTASYTSTQTTTGGTGKYPLSTQTLEFIQSQILLLQQLALIGGNRYILKEPDGKASGVAVIDGEVLVLAAKPVRNNNVKYVVVKTEKQDIEADGETYVEARTVRSAVYSTTKTGGEEYEINTFTNFAPNTTLATQIKQTPETVLTYLKDVLNEKLSSIEVTGMTTAKLDSIKTPCLVSCKNSVAMYGSTLYSVMVSKLGDFVRQELTLPDNQKFVRIFTNTAWKAWSRVTDNLHIEVKIARNTVYLRHAALPADADIILLRKKKRSKFRSTGGAKAYTKNRGKRITRLPKTQYVHFKGIVLTHGEPGKWYVPKCLSVADKAVDGHLIDKELPTLCKSMITETVDADGVKAFRVQGVRNLVSDKNGRKRQHKAFAPIAIQIARQRGNVSKDAGGEMVKMKYRIARKKLKNSATTTWYRSFSLG